MRLESFASNQERGSDGGHCGMHQALVLDAGVGRAKRGRLNVGSGWRFGLGNLASGSKHQCSLLPDARAQD